MNRLALYSDLDMLGHDTGRHPERVDRLRAIVRGLEISGISHESPLSSPSLATIDQIGRIHSIRYIASVERQVRNGGGYLDADTVVSPGSFQAALRSAGGAIAAMRSVVLGTSRYAFALGRPPGHHARPMTAMGFCLFNNVAIAAREAQATLGVERIAIVDIDVHHGNGTQESFEEDPNILFISTHQYPFYPGGGSMHEIGIGAGRGHTINVPLPRGSGDEVYLAAVERVIIPALYRHRPELILLSVGYDAHWSDPLAEMRLSISGYATIIGQLVEAANDLCAGRLALVLEGGYDLDALASGIVATCRVLRSEPWDDPIGSQEPLLGVADVEQTLATLRAVHDLP